MVTWFANIRMAPKLIGLFLAVGLLPMMLLSWLAWNHAREDLLTEAFDQLESIREIKKEQIRNYVEERWHDLRAAASISKIMRNEAFKKLALIQNNKKHEIEHLFKMFQRQLHTVKDAPFIHQALVDFEKTFTDLNHRVGTPSWHSIADKYRARLRDITKDNGWPDLLLIHPKGGILFTVAGKDDLGRVIPDSFLKNTSLGMAWRSAQAEGQDKMVLSEFFPYQPASHKQTAFMMAPAMDAQGVLLGYIAMPIGSEHINAIVQQRAGLGQSGEPYLVGRVNGTTLYRSDRIAKKGRFGEERSDIFIEKALAGKSGGETKIGSTGLVELVYYAPLNIPGLAWAILTTMSAQEAITPLAEQNASEDLFSQYVKEKGLYDMFLISSDGTTFYSVGKKTDYQTNLIHGPLSQSSFGQLVQATLKSRSPGMSDFAPYRPSGTGQYAFMVTPIMVGHDIELLVALEISSLDLDKILNKREGMGKTGETFLVGKWNGRTRFRNDRLHQKGKAGYDVPKQINAIVHEAYDNVGMLVNNDGDKELVSHTKLAIPGLHWTLLATVDFREVQAPIQGLFQSIAQAALGLTVLVILIAFLTSRSIITPIYRLTATTKRIVDGDWSARVAVKSSDEMGELGTFFNQLAQFIEEQYWLQASLAQFAELIQKSASPKELSQQLISQLATVLEVGHGVVYVLKENGKKYKLQGSFGYQERKNVAHVFAEGESLMGQCVFEKKSILLTNAPENYVKISSGLGEAKPLTLLAVPISFQDKVLAVIEIASFNPITPIQRALLEKLAQMIGLGLENLFRHQRTQKLLVKTQAQAKALARQQELLKTNNEELQQQAQTLLASEEELHTQRVALQTANDKLQEKTEYLQKNQVDLESARAQLEEKAQALEQSSRYKSEFLANMSHELRTPLNSLLILSKSFATNEDGNLTEEQIESSRIIYGSGQDLLKLINDILDLAKIESGRMEIHPEDIVIRDWAETVKTQFGHVAKDKGLVLVVEIAEEVPEIIHTDPMKMQQILKNFISNACKFTSVGQVVIHIQPPPRDRRVTPNEYRIVADSNQKKALSIGVSDTGIGIPEDKLGLIFEAFKQADGGTSRQYGGTGLGLSISRELALLLGGEIRLRSTVGEGSTFTLLLPETLDKTLPVKRSVPSKSSPEPKRRKKDNLSASQPASQPVPPPFSEEDHQHLTPEEPLLLIIDNDPDFATLACHLFREKGLKCLIATGGCSAMDLAKRHKPKGIILALTSSDPGSMAILTLLKEEPSTRNIPVYITSAEEPSREALQKGAAGHLKKPVEPEAFAALIKKIEYFSGSSKRQVLVVEDDTQTCKIITDLLQGDTVAVMAVRTGEAAYRLLQEEPFDCMVLDLGLPDISGFELLKRLSQNEAIPNLPVIIYSGRELSREEHEKLVSLSDGVVIKGAHSEERLIADVTLFLHSRVDTLSAKQQAMLQKANDPQRLFQEKSVLVVDDDMRNAFAMKKTLRLKGFQVLIAANGRKALTLLEEHPNVDIVLMDIMMPEMDGYQTMQEIRKQERFQQLPILAVSAKAMLEDRKKCLDAGANDFIAKPVDMERLGLMLRFWLYRGSLKLC